ncbi:hypothetical protein ACIG0C_02410 [Kitasatospora aureofaciens]|uniref:hypothetical protein n=1 Tax=Kitasatospora aureofaciens TaxID=1894 RepID=UPI0012FECAB2|nr:hypothetical protein [Kitasatospora aureofaciens]
MTTAPPGSPATPLLRPPSSENPLTSTAVPAGTVRSTPPNTENASTSAEAPSG